MQKERDEVLGVTVEDIRKLADYVDAFLSDDCLCVVGNEDEIRKNSDLFMNMENLFH
jgi:Zn-dependent M16 (insulinase) family peptidase